MRCSSLHAPHLASCPELGWRLVQRRLASICSCFMVTLSTLRTLLPHFMQAELQHALLCRGMQAIVRQLMHLYSAIVAQLPSACTLAGKAGSAPAAAPSCAGEVAATD